MKLIQLTHGKVAKVSDHRFEYLNQWKWRAEKDHTRDNWYARRVYKAKTISMHREITNAPTGMEVDHKDGDGLNNQDENLRVCTKSQNQANSTQRKNKSGYRGVSLNKGIVAEIKINGKTTHIGMFKTLEDAARAYDKRAREAFGEFARLNFPNERQP